jgi:hypothetical protein
VNLQPLFRPHDPCSKCGLLHPRNRAVVVKVAGTATFDGVLCPEHVDELPRGAA